MTRLGIFAALAVMLLQPVAAAAHAFLLHADPGAGAVLAQAPKTVRLRFNSELEPRVSTLIVKDAGGVRASEGEGVVDARAPATISTRLLTTRKGRYHVYWRVVSRDGHRTEGDYTFTVK